MRKLILLIITAVLFSIPTVTLADSDNHAQSVDEVLAEIKTQQNITEIKDIDCDSVTDEQWEELGEAVMSVMHPDSQQHELMDQMMSGEGSESLQIMHINMGQAYLGCGSSGMMSGEMMSMMNGIMMGGNMMNNSLADSSFKNSDGKWGNSMMGFPTTAGFSSGWMIFGWLFMIFFWILVILAIVWLIKVVAGNTGGQNKNLTVQEILKMRYAKGEISKKEFDEMKKEIS